MPTERASQTVLGKRMAKGAFQEPAWTKAPSCRRDGEGTAAWTQAVLCKARKESDTQQVNTHLVKGDKKMFSVGNLVLFTEVLFVAELWCPLYTRKQRTSLLISNPPCHHHSWRQHRHMSVTPPNWQITFPHLSRFLCLARGVRPWGEKRVEVYPAALRYGLSCLTG